MIYGEIYYTTEELNMMSDRQLAIIARDTGAERLRTDKEECGKDLIPLIRKVMDGEVDPYAEN